MFSVQSLPRIAGALNTKTTMKKIAIVGASGYSGEELVRLLLSHPLVELTTVTSRQSAGQTLGRVFPRFASHPKSKTLRFTEPNRQALRDLLDGVDQLFTGKVERVDTDFLQSLLADGIIPVLPPLGFDGEGRTYRVNSDGVALEVAEALRAAKTCLTRGKGEHESHHRG